MSKVSMFPTIRETKNGKDCDLLQFYEAVKNGRWKDDVEAVRQGKQDKRTLPYATISGTFTERNEAGLKEHSGKLAIDIDNVGDSLYDIKETLKEDKYTEFISTSVSGNGLFVVVDIPPKKHAEAFKFFQTYYRAFYNLEIDKACKDISRARIVSYDPECFYKEAKPLELPDNILKAESVGNGWIYDQLQTKIFNANEGEKHNERLKTGLLAGGYIASGAINELQTLSILEDAISNTHTGNPQDLKKEIKALHDGIEKGMERPISPSLRPKQKELKELPKDDFLKLEASLRVNYDDEFDEPQKVLDYKGVHFATVGNIVTITGKAKSRKSSLLSFFAAAFMKSDLLHGFKGHKVGNKKYCVLYDTEQDNFYIHRNYKRIVRLSGLPEEYSENLKVYKLRTLSYKQRKEFIEKHISSLEGVGLVMIDGIKDIVGDINDQTESTETVDYLMRLADINQFSLVVVIHQNKGNNQERGALGTELQNKSETVLEVVKDDNDSNISIVRARFSRNRDIEEFAFSIDEFGLPYVLEDYAPGMGEIQRKPNELDEKIHKDILTKTFTLCKYEQPSINQFRQSLTFAVSELNYNYSTQYIKLLGDYYVTVCPFVELIEDGKFKNLRLTDFENDDLLPF